jgi:hypothetical protein
MFNTLRRMRSRSVSQERTQTSSTANPSALVHHDLNARIDLNLRLIRLHILRRARCLTRSSKMFIFSPICVDFATVPSVNSMSVAAFRAMPLENRYAGDASTHHDARDVTQPRERCTMAVSTETRPWTIEEVRRLPDDGNK